MFTIQYVHKETKAPVEREHEVREVVDVPASVDDDGNEVPAVTHEETVPMEFPNGVVMAAVSGEVTALLCSHVHTTLADASACRMAQTKRLAYHV